MVQATSRDLATFHARRAKLYRVIAEMLGAPPTPRALEIIRDLLAEIREANTVSAELSSAVGASVPQENLTGFLEMAGSTDALSCNDEHAPIRSIAFAATGRREDEHVGSDALVLAALAERSARALKQDDLSEAAALCDLQHRFLTEHAGACLGAVAHRLEETSSPYFAHLGRALEKLVFEDLQQLDDVIPSVRKRAAHR
jgi:hypothetical protein